MIRKVKPYVQGMPSYWAHQPWNIRFLLVTHESGWIFKSLHGQMFDTEAEAEAALFKRIDAEEKLRTVDLQCCKAVAAYETTRLLKAVK
jgi:hypothetical protein